MAVVGISGSPIINGNTDRMTMAILEQSARDAKFINLSTLNFGACRGCAHNCAATAMCGVNDELREYLADIRDADALVIGSPVHHGTMTAWMYGLFSRLWCFLHENETLNNRPAVFISTGIDSIPEQGPPTFSGALVKAHRFNVLGHIYFQSLTPPCFKCGKGDTCQCGGLWRMVRRDVEALDRFKITPDKFRRWEDDEQVVDDVKTYGNILSEI
jgi:multimeric flavodoxin WrbA